MSNAKAPSKKTTPHPYFADPDTDVVITAADSTMFRIHSVVLRQASGFFRGMLTLPQPSSTSPGALKIIPMEEDAVIVEALLRAIMSKPFPPKSLGPLELFAK
jgi:hypothetical protein